MKYAIHRISLDINDDSPSQLTLSARQGDTAKLLIITLLADKHNYIIAEGCYASFIGKKADGASFEHECVIDRKTNKIEYAFQPLTVSTSGRIDCEINLYSEFGERLTTSRFNIQVYETIFTGEVNDAEDDITAVTQLRADLNALIANIEQKLENGEFVGEKGEKGESVTIDKTLTIEKAAADAKAVGDKFKEVEEKLEGVEDIVVDSELSSESENPVQNKVLAAALGEKLDKVESTGSLKFYGVSRQGEQVVIHGADTGGLWMPGRVATYVNEANSGGTATGFLHSAYPTKPYHCANKKYVDENIPKLYKHSLEFFTTMPDGEYGAFLVEVLSFKSTSFSPSEVLFLKGQTLINPQDNKFVNVLNAFAGSFTIINDSGEIEQHAIVSDGSLPFDDSVAEYIGG